MTGVGVAAKWPVMLAPVLEKLLILQDRDAKRLSLEAQLKAVPRDIAAVEGKIAGEKGAIETARLELRELESNKKIIETEIGSAEDKLANLSLEDALELHALTRAKHDCNAKLFITADFELLEIQARLLARVVTGELPEYPGFETR